MVIDWFCHPTTPKESRVLDIIKNTTKWPKLRKMVYLWWFSLTKCAIFADILPKNDHRTCLLMIYSIVLQNVVKYIPKFSISVQKSYFSSKISHLTSKIHFWTTFFLTFWEMWYPPSQGTQFWISTLRMLNQV